MSEDDLRRLLKDAAPRGLSAPDRASSARLRAARRRQRYVGAVGAAAVLVAIGVPVALSERTHKHVDPATVTPTTFSCADLAEPTAGVPAKNATELEASNVVAVRLCNLNGSRYQEPADALKGVPAQQLATFVNGLANQPPPLICDLMLHPSFDFAFEYADGRAETVRAAEGGCGGITIANSTTRGTGGDANEFFAKFTDDLLAQRASSEPPAGLRVPSSCQRGAQGDYRLRFTALDAPGIPELTNAVLCWTQGPHADGGQDVAIGSADLKVIIADMRSHQQDTPPGGSYGYCSDETLTYQIVGTNAWGDRYLLVGFCGEFDLREVGGTGYWVPNRESASILHRLASP